MRAAIATLATILTLVPNAAMSADTNAVEPHRSSIIAEVAFTNEEIRVIRAYYESGRTGNHKGRDRRKAKMLPPGIAKNLARGKPLPPGIAKRNLPVELLVALPPVPDGHERIIVDGKILLIEIATQIVRDVLSDVLLN